MINSKGIRILCYIVMGIAYILSIALLIFGIKAMINNNSTIGWALVIGAVVFPLIMTVSLYPIFALSNIEDDLRDLKKALCKNPSSKDQAPITPTDIPHSNSESDREVTSFSNSTSVQSAPKRLTFKEIEREDFDGIYAAMERNFIPDERRDYAHAKRVLDCPEFHLFHVERENEKVGFVSYWRLNGVTFFEHFVIYEAFRGNGIGEQVLALMKEKFSPLVLECERPESPLQARRAAFYKRNGFCENDCDYYQPAYSQIGNEVPMLLLSYPSPLVDPHAVAAQIRREVYERTK